MGAFSTAVVLWLRRECWVDDTKTLHLQWRNSRETHVGRHKDELIGQIHIRSESAGELYRIKATQGMWLHLPVLVAQFRCQREDRRGDRNEPVERNGADEIAERDMAIKPVHHCVNIRGVKRIGTSEPADCGYYLDLRQL